jgi:hypothetical protein
MRSRTSGVSKRRAVAALAVVVATLALAGPGASASKGPTELFGYSCCGGGFGTINYHPGEVVDVDWIRVPKHLMVTIAKTITLNVKASGPYASIALLKRSFAKSHPTYGKTNFAAAAIHVSDLKPASPVSVLRIPATAGTGFYEVTIHVQKGQASSGGGLIISVRP